MSSAKVQWRLSCQPPTLDSCSLHVWRVFVPNVLSSLAALECILSNDEQARAGRYCRDQDRTRFIVARGVLRTLLSGYLAVHPERIAFHYGPQGKPYLVMSLNKQDIYFNISHSCDWIVFAFARGRAVGIDIEYMSSALNYETIAKSVLCANELNLFNLLGAEERAAVFFDIWTRKEAYVKAIGKGFSLSAAEVEVSFGPNAVPMLLHASREPNPQRWCFQLLDVADKYSAALIVEEPTCKPLCLEWISDFARNRMIKLRESAS